MHPSFRAFLSGALAVQDDLDAEQIDRVSRHLGGIATVYLAHDAVAHSVAMRISGIMSPDDMRIVEKRIEKFAEEYCSAGAILLSEWNGLSRWLVVGMNWQVQCLLKFAAVEEQFARLAQKDIDFLVRLEPNESTQGRRGNLVTSFSVTADEPSR
ncbi:hypothetical protein M0D69_01290 [Caballeronia sp. SEWSISQ10-4 2]|uniref:hypothetical protein n=1 Tax=Caballeronia sp. SEWSISQ10-4 2 TaxID=2937438 RepID=UPI0026530686|nr:hypothetical protein [Caballeronia sp. SEWSISQ10-4 2]MDN7176677.1 hypothetical protein [Caballeronia sp. SEWSISQ10-4 2]